MVKGDLAIYLVNVKLGQVLPMINCPPDINNYVCGENEVKMFVLMCNTETGKFKGIQKLSGYTSWWETTMSVFLATAMIATSRLCFFQALSRSY